MIKNKFTPMTSGNGGGQCSLFIKLCFNVIKTYRKHISSLIQIKIATLSKNEEKISKWQNTPTERLKNFNIALELLKECAKLYPHIKYWTNSKEFKERYLNTNYLYPPLLNPDSIDYKSISAELAWELNLPLPPNYDYIYLTSGSSASEASMYFFGECNVCFNRPGYDSKKAFLHCYEFLQSDTDSRKKGLFFYTGEVSSYTNAQHLVASIHKKVPIFYIARDPIGRIKHMLNHIENVDVKQIRTKRNLKSDFADFFPKLTYSGGVDKPSFDYLQCCSDDSWLVNTTLNTSSAFNGILDKAKFIHCIDFSDMKFEKAFETYCDLANVLGFDKPKNKELFTNRITPTTSTLTFLPFDIYAHIDDIFSVNMADKQINLKSEDSSYKEGGYVISITAQHLLPMLKGEFMAAGYIDRSAQKVALTTDLVDITDEICPNLIIDDVKILVITQKGLKDNEILYNAAKDYVNGLINYFKIKVKGCKDQQLSEKDVLEFFRTNLKSRKFIKNVLDRELGYIKLHYPHFIDKWDSYKEFEKICAELDGGKV